MNLNDGKIKFSIIAIVIGAVVLLGVAVVILINVLGKSPVEGPNDDPPIEDVQKTPAEKAIVNTRQAGTRDSKREIDINMPRFASLSDYSFQEYINKRMGDTAVDYQKEIEIVIGEEDTPIDTKYRYNVDYDRYDNENYVSLIVNHNYQTGGMRSNNWKDTYNVDVVRNTEIYLVDLFDSTTDYKKEIINEINKQAKSKNQELVGGNGLKDIPEKQKFYIKNGELVIYFDPAAIAPYLYGPLDYTMPFNYNKDTGKFEV